MELAALGMTMTDGVPRLQHLSVCTGTRQLLYSNLHQLLDPLAHLGASRQQDWPPGRSGQERTAVWKACSLRFY
ncbi:unnamed protein product [Vitrella brassicaformis CCMP3155]|uniref:Uncharacterized protein n=1 Tax=Vitrella brassicaformis (strain CCMP3155) TaxID=1169540 RepID=A0A0G4GXJ8_VITBC|nr:unnamed protein product [Vitrella brassicaformis CCMP3155]|eukprot:CEM35705.1 unnamed protein product [Vitrella brassicaformis CCMP3155]